MIGLKQRITLTILKCNYLWAFFVAPLTCRRNLRIKKKVLLLPAATLDGGFGDDIMVRAFVHVLHDVPISIINDGMVNNKLFSGIKNVNIIQRYWNLNLYTAYLRLFRDHTDFYIIGADILDGVYDSNKMRFRLAHLAHAAECKVHITGFSVRENPSKYFLDQMKSISRFTSIKLRDSKSYERMRKLLPCVQSSQCSDIAFLCDCSKEEVDDDYKTWIDNSKKNGETIMAYCPNTIQAKNLGLEEYMKKQLVLLNNFQELHCSVVFLYHDLRKYVLNMSDKDLSHEIFERFTGNKFFIDSIADGYSLKTYISLADFVVTGRMHMGISGYTMGLPMFGVCYYNKFEGVQHFFDIPIQVSLMECTNIDSSVEKYKAFMESLDNYKKNVSQNIGKVKELSLENF